MATAALCSSSRSHKSKKALDSYFLCLVKYDSNPQSMMENHLLRWTLQLTATQCCGSGGKDMGKSLNGTTWMAIQGDPRNDLEEECSN